MGTIIIKHDDLESMQVYEDRGFLRTSHGQAVDFDKCKVICRFCLEEIDTEEEEDVISGCCEDCRLNVGGL